MELASSSMRAKSPVEVLLADIVAGNGLVMATS